MSSGLTLSTGALGDSARPQSWPAADLVRSTAREVAAGASLDIRFKERFLYTAALSTGDDALWPVLDLINAGVTRNSPATYPSWNFLSGSEVGRLTEFGAGQLRYGSLGRLVESAGTTNLLRNPRGEGAVVGDISADGALPTHWSSLNVSAGTADLSVVGFGVEDGWDYVDIRWQTTGATTSLGVGFETNDEISGSASTDYALSYGAKIVAGDLTNVSSISLHLRTRNAGVDVGSPTNAAETPSASRRYFVSRWTTDASVIDSAVPFIDLDTTGAADVTIRLYAPQLEVGTDATSLALPPRGAPAQATRAAETLTGDSVIVARNSRATYLGWDQQQGGVVTEFFEVEPNVARIGSYGLLVEEGRTNLIRNPRGEGAVAGVIGSGGALPTNWSSSFNNAALEVINPAASYRGIPVSRLQISGGVNGDTEQLFMEGQNTVPVAAGQTVIFSLFVRIDSGDFSALSRADLQLNWFTSGGAANGNTFGTSENQTILTADGLLRRFWVKAVAPANTAFAQPTIRFTNSASSAPVQFDIGGLQMETGEFPTSPVFPPVGIYGAAQRVDEAVYIPRADLLEATGFDYVLKAETMSGEAVLMQLGGVDAAADRAGVYINSSGSLRSRYVVGSGGEESSINSGAFLDVTKELIVAGRIAQGDLYVTAKDSAGGTFSASDASPTSDIMGAATRIMLGSEEVNRFLNGFLRTLRIFPLAGRTTADLDALLETV